MGTKGYESVEIVPVDAANVLKVEKFINSINLTLFISTEFWENLLQGLKLNDWLIQIRFDRIQIKNLAYFIKFDRAPLSFKFWYVYSWELVP